MHELAERLEVPRGRDLVRPSPPPPLETTGEVPNIWTPDSAKDEAFLPSLLRQRRRQAATGRPARGHLPTGRRPARRSAAAAARGEVVVVVVHARRMAQAALVARRAQALAAAQARVAAVGAGCSQRLPALKHRQLNLRDTRSRTRRGVLNKQIHRRLKIAFISEQTPSIVDCATPTHAQL